MKPTVPRTFAGSTFENALALKISLMSLELHNQRLLQFHRRVHGQPIGFRKRSGSSDDAKNHRTASFCDFSDVH